MNRRRFFLVTATALRPGSPAVDQYSARGRAAKQGVRDRRAAGRGDEASALARGGDHHLGWNRSAHDAFAEAPLPANPDCGDLPGFDEPVDRAEVDLEVLQDFLRRQKRFVNH